jgi:hypothetical protein
MDIGTAIEKYGIPTAILIIVVIAMDKRVWPFIVAQVTAWQADRKAEREAVTADRIHERDAFLAALANLQTAAAAGHAAAADRDRVIAEQIESMARSVKEIALLTKHNYSALHPATSSTRRKRATVVN